MLKSPICGLMFHCERYDILTNIIRIIKWKYIMKRIIKWKILIKWNWKIWNIEWYKVLKNMKYWKIWNFEKYEILKNIKYWTIWNIEKDEI